MPALNKTRVGVGGLDCSLSAPMRLQSAPARAQAERQQVWGLQIQVAVFLYMHFDLPADVPMAIVASIDPCFFPIDLTW
jgi:hypothetical protein